MKVSIIVPIYNTYQYLDKCIGSLVNQTTTEEYEIILVNDCSPDDSLTKLREWESKFPNKIKVIDSKTNLRQGGARNLGLDVSTGKYIMFVDSDDWIEEFALTWLLQVANIADSDVILAQRATLICNDGQKEGAVDVNYNISNIQVEDRRTLILADDIGVCNCLIKKSVLDENKIRFKENTFYEDCLFTFLLALYIKSISTIPQTYYKYNKTNENSTTSIDNERHWEIIEIYNDMYELSMQWDKNSQYVNEIIGAYTQRMINSAFHFSLNRFSKPQYAKLKYMLKILKKKVPKYKYNYYFKLYSRRTKFAVKIATISPKLYYFLKKLLG